MDVRQSRRDCVYVDSFWEKASLRIEAGTRLRFESFFTSESLKRRKDAVDKVLQGSGRTADLVSAFDPQRNSIPTNFSWVPDNDLIASYQLNEEQELALRGVISKRPLSLVQGPPGTGKTRFIAALAHYALTHGLARSVLLSSQSHEAVNTAIEGVIKHFANEGEKPSVFRVGANTVDATGELQQYFARNLEQSLKDRFSASFKDRIRIAGKSLVL
ncbi:AAA domain-containing protein [Sulfitobacter sp. OXR-159]|uniref:AAA domain-containing protein n=1 Tax=Sulfitobacter sp. OXR-159 TaxID=3100174 RepID=UPI002AC97AB4|nr:AAA domain-containing protein [Sulfitobacter sp. OXR-159]WPZ29163.1 AAA domain-containing protein [Sulfitobacter sp. OXR-159]